MIKKAFENITLSLEYVLSNLKVGDKVAVNSDIPNGANTEIAIKKDSEFEVRRLDFSLSDSPGMFVLDIFGGWGFHFGENGLGWMFDHLIMSEEDELGSDFGDIPFMVYKVLEEYKVLGRSDLISKVLEGNMMVPLREKKKVFNNIDDAILSMLKLDYLDISDRKGNDGEQMVYITDKGNQVLGA